MIQEEIGEVPLQPFSPSLSYHTAPGCTDPSLSYATATSLWGIVWDPTLQPLITTFHPSLCNATLDFMKHTENSIQAMIQSSSILDVLEHTQPGKVHTPLETFRIQHCSITQRVFDWTIYFCQSPESGPLL